MNEIAILNPEGVHASEYTEYKIREAARSIVFDQNKRIALLHVSKKNYYKLPGGGIDAHEDSIDALRRECLEEIGCHISDIKELGMVIEFRKMFKIKQVSYCYVSNVRGTKGVPSFTESEINDEFKIIWVTLTEAEDLFKNVQTDDKEGLLYIIPRDLKILEAVVKVTS